MVGIAQLVEHQIVALRAVGSSPTTHPKILEINQKSCTLKYIPFGSGCGAIGSALALGARGCQFESGHPDHLLKIIVSFLLTPTPTFPPQITILQS